MPSKIFVVHHRPALRQQNISRLFTCNSSHNGSPSQVILSEVRHDTISLCIFLLLYPVTMSNGFMQTLSARIDPCLYPVTSHASEKMAAAAPQANFKLVLVGDGGTGKVRLSNRSYCTLELRRLGKSAGPGTCSQLRAAHNITTTKLTHLLDHLRQAPFDWRV